MKEFQIDDKSILTLKNVVYCITNLINGKKYVGMTTRTLGQRLREHQHHAEKKFVEGDAQTSMPIVRAIKKYGVENFSVEILQRDLQSGEDETKWIAKLGTFGDPLTGYNLTIGGEGTSGRIASEETRELQRQNMLNMSNEQRENMSKAAKARYENGWGQELRSRRKKGKEHHWSKNPVGRRHEPLSDETKKKISIAHTGKKLSQAHKDAIQKGCTGKPGHNRDKIMPYQNMNRKPIFVFNDNEEMIMAYLTKRSAPRALVKVITYKNGLRYENGLRYMKSKLTVREMLEKEKS